MPGYLLFFSYFHILNIYLRSHANWHYNSRSVSKIKIAHSFIDQISSLINTPKFPVPYYALRFTHCLRSFSCCCIYFLFNSTLTVEHTIHSTTLRSVIWYIEHVILSHVTQLMKFALRLFIISHVIIIHMNFFCMSRLCCCFLFFVYLLVWNVNFLYVDVSV